jgi:hypothetical protein
VQEYGKDWKFFLRRNKTKDFENNSKADLGFGA